MGNNKRVLGDFIKWYKDKKKIRNLMFLTTQTEDLNFIYKCCSAQGIELNNENTDRVMKVLNLTKQEFEKLVLEMQKEKSHSGK